MRASKWLSTVSSLGLIAGVLAGNLAHAGDDRYFITNQSGVVIDELYLSASEEKSWGEDILGRDTLAKGEQVEIVFDHDDDRCEWDLAVKDTNGNELEWDKLDLCKYTSVTLKPKGVAEMQ